VGPCHLWRLTWLTCISTEPASCRISFPDSFKIYARQPIVLGELGSNSCFSVSCFVQRTLLWGGGIIVNFPRLWSSIFAAIVYELEIFSLIEAIDTRCCPLGPITLTAHDCPAPHLLCCTRAMAAVESEWIETWLNIRLHRPMALIPLRLQRPLHQSPKL
jgi:hypothetical protein